jgi:osmotically-inducible protein OsmY
MSNSSALLYLQAELYTDDQQEAQRTATFVAQCLEDLRLAERIERALRATGYSALRDIKITVHIQVVILEGRVPSFHMKQIAQSLAQSVPGTTRVQNDLKVVELRPRKRRP